MVELSVLVSVAYLLLLFTLSRRPRPDILPAPEGLAFAFVIPCLDESAVIGATLDSLVPVLRGDDIVLVVDDGSSDDTPNIVRAYPSRACTCSAASFPTRARARAKR